ncbi:MAG: glycosyltransferase [Chitinophagaceae bacterium]
MTSDKKKILLFTDWYYPGYKAGGPIQSCRNIVKTMNDAFEFFVFTSDRDLGDSSPYSGVALNTWGRGENGEAIFYASPEKITLRFLMNILRSVSPETVYLNSMFSFRYTVLPRLAMKLSRYPGKIVLAPRGMLHNGALEMKAKKKFLFLRTFQILGLHKRILFHATDATEVDDLRNVFPICKTMLVENIPNRMSMAKAVIKKESGKLKMIFLSRVHPKKNLHYILNILLNQKFNGEICLDIFGDTKKNTYAAECSALAALMPENVSIRFEDGIPNDQVFEVLSNYHCFILPTQGENFGHAIFEALTAGVPVLISDQTPWRALESRKAGWDIPLRNNTAFTDAIERLLAMEQPEWEEWSNGARSLANEFLQETGFNDKYQALFS